MLILKNGLRMLEQFKQKHLLGSSHLYIWIGITAIIVFPVLFVVWRIWFPYQNDLVAPEYLFLGSLFGFSLTVSPFFPQKVKHYIPWLWLLSLIYIFPYFFTYVFLVTKANDIASMALLSSVFLMVLLVDLVSLVVALALGISLAVLSYVVSAPDIYFNREHLEVALLGSFFIVAGTTVNYRTIIVNAQRMKGMSVAAGMIAHELRTPLLGIKSGAQALQKIMPNLFEGYTVAEQNGLVDKAVSKRKLEQLSGVNERIISETNYANTIIDMLLMKAGREKALFNCHFESCSMAEVLQKSLSRYPFRNEAERQSVAWQGDFKFSGSKLLMEHVIFNLLKNALYVIKKAGKGQVFIWTERRDSFNYLYFKDTATGMNKRQIKQLFDHFYTTTPMGTGIGLSYCKMVMERFDGEIDCTSMEGEYTLFHLKFPILKDQKMP